MCVIEETTYVYSNGVRRTVPGNTRFCNHSNGTRTCSEVRYERNTSQSSDPGSPIHGGFNTPLSLSNPPTPTIMEVRPNNSHDSRRTSSDNERGRKNKRYRLQINIGGSSKNGKDREKSYHRRSAGSAVFSSGDSAEGLNYDSPRNSIGSSAGFRSNRNSYNGPAASTYAPPPPPPTPPRNRPSRAGSPSPSPDRNDRHRRRHLRPIIHQNEDRAPEILERDAARADARRRRSEAEEAPRIEQEAQAADARRERQRPNARENQRQADRLAREQADRRSREEAEQLRRQDSQRRADERHRLRELERENATRPTSSGRQQQPPNQPTSSNRTQQPTRQPGHGRRRSSLVRPDVQETLANMADERANVHAQEQQEAMEDEYRERYNPRVGATFTSPPHGYYALPSPSRPYHLRTIAPTENDIAARGTDVLAAARARNAHQNMQTAIQNAMGDMTLDDGDEQAFGPGLSRRDTLNGGRPSQRKRDQYFEDGRGR